jgi:hypothetical protein
MRGNPTTANRASAHVLAAAVLVGLLALISSRARSQEQPADVPRSVMDAEGESAIKRDDRIWFGAVLAVYLVANAAVLWTTLA